ncbi:hypothetical protein SLEP1_g49278 [Rubroshorea leprosula]|uniref:Uncharacterized protein n=1 Tax=Rubroshorea leprosula TaxID=152421 RepID=A0AAV5LYR7_9ROSI|nr:hypothetical protein SLEP1_g49278 [Rubroshorea leprosula]
MDISIRWGIEAAVKVPSEGGCFDINTAFHVGMLVVFPGSIMVAVTNFYLPNNALSSNARGRDNPFSKTLQFPYYTSPERFSIISSGSF